MSKIYAICMVLTISVSIMAMENEKFFSALEDDHSLSKSDESHGSNEKSSKLQRMTELIDFTVDRILSSKKEIVKEKEVAILSDEQIRKRILAGHVKTLAAMKDQIPVILFDKRVREWAKLGGHDDLAKSLNPNTLFKDRSWKKAKEKAPTINAVKKALFFAATYGDLIFFETAKKEWRSSNHDPVNDELKACSEIAEELGYKGFAKHIKKGKALSENKKKIILNECLEVNKIRMDASGDEVINLLFWDFVSNAKDVIEENFSNTVLAWLKENNLSFPIIEWNAEEKKLVAGILRFDLDTWNLLDRKKLLTSLSESYEVQSTLEERNEYAVKFYSIFDQYNKGASMDSAQALSVLNKGIIHGVDLEARFETKSGLKTPAEWANDRGLKTLALAFTHKHLWFLFDQEKLAKIVTEEDISHKVKQTMILGQ